LEQFDVTSEIRVIPNFVDVSRFRRQQKDHFKRVLSPNDEKVVIHVSNFRRVKRAPEVVRVFARLLDAGIKAKLLLVGDGPDRPTAEHLARELGVDMHTRFLGKQEPVEEILSIADLFLMPSGSESFGLAALEAMACEVPVVSSDIGGLPELNVDGETGFVCPLDDEDAFFEKARFLLENEDERKRMAQNAGQRAEELFDIERIVPQYEHYYEEILARKGEVIIEP
jgi:N-acetyl-alpha-D-glucosaminyl L-malate synthase BshA